MTITMDTRLLFVLVAALATAPPLDAAVTGLAATGDDTPRAAWFERFSEARQGPEHTDRVTETFKVGQTGALDLSNIAGNVRVTGGGGQEIRVEAVKRVRHRDSAEAARQLEQLRIEMTNVGGRIEVRTVYPRRSGGQRVSASVEYTVSVPARADVTIKSISGDLSVDRVSGVVRAETVSGDVGVTETPNVALAKTISGDITARAIGGSATLTLNSVSGNVVATELQARSLECGTISGDLRITGARVERLLAKSVSGDIEFGAVLAEGGRYEFNSHSGDVRITLGDGPGFDLDAATFSGSVRSDLPITLRTNDTGNRARTGRRETRAIRGVHGKPSAVLSAQTFSGDIVIARR